LAQIIEGFGGRLPAGGRPAPPKSGPGPFMSFLTNIRVHKLSARLCSTMHACRWNGEPSPLHKFW